MASKTFNQTRPWCFDPNPSPDTIFHFPMSPSEPGKFDFYRVHLANQAYHSNTKLSDTNSDAPILTAPKMVTTKRRWTPFADIVSSDQSKPSILSNSNTLSKTQTTSSSDSSVSSNTNSKSNESISSVSSFPSLTDLVKNAMSKGQLNGTVNKIRRPASGTILSTKDLNHLSPQSM